VNTESTSVDGLMTAVYDELRMIAGRLLEHERRDHTLQPTALVHEAYLRLERQLALASMDKCEFLAIAAVTVRRILVEHARRRDAGKRAGGFRRIALRDELAAVRDDQIDLLALDEAMHRLGSFDPRKAQIVELRFFGGLTVDEVAELLELSPRSIADDWALARAWLRRQLASDGGGP